MKQSFRRLFQLIIFFLVIRKCLIKVRLFRELVQMDELLETELVLIENLNKYIAKSENKLMILKSNLARFKEAHNKAGSDIPTYISNPINAFLIIKRLTVDWREIEDLMSNDVNKEFLKIVTFFRKKLNFPKYGINGTRFRTEIRRSECKLEYQRYLNYQYFYLLAAEQSEEMSNKTDILDYLAFSSIKKRILELTRKMSDTLLKRPTIEIDLINKAYYDKQEPKMNKPIGIDTSLKSYYNSELQYYKRWCANKIRRPERELAKLHCRYVNNKSTFLKIGPLKLEEVHLNPYIVIYHEILYDNEIEMINKLAKLRFTDLEWYKPVIETGWLMDEHTYIRNIDRRVEDMTGLASRSAEPLHIMNYSIGSQFKPRFDFVSNVDVNVFDSFEAEDRIATVLLYLNDVSKGGATVFPKLNIVLSPKKATAVVWMNLYTSGKGNNLMLHGDCPVLQGSKLAAKKWLHLQGQEWNRPCGLQDDHLENNEHLTKFI